MRLPLRCCWFHRDSGRILDRPARLAGRALRRGGRGAATADGYEALVDFALEGPL
jgi:hypothetical protein